MGLLKEQTTTQQRNKIFLNIKNGGIYKRTPAGEEIYKAVAGDLSYIYTKEREFRGEKVLYWYIDLEDGENIYSLGFGYSSNIFKSIILSLSTCKDYKEIKIEPYIANNYEKVNVYSGETKLSWGGQQMPPIIVKEIGGRRIKDDTERMEYICNKVKGINSTLQETSKLVNK